MADTNPNQGEGWYEFIKQPNGTTHIVSIGEYGAIYIPESGVTVADFLYAVIHNDIHRLIRADEVL